jgi:Putative prokaryotic signal transducing protein
MMNDGELVVVRDFLSKAEAEIAQGALRANDIESIIQADDAGGTEPGLWMGGIKLLVRAVDTDRASQILKPAE